MTRSPDSLVPSDSGQPEPEKRDDKALTCWQGGEANLRAATEVNAISASSYPPAITPIQLGLFPGRACPLEAKPATDRNAARVNPVCRDGVQGVGGGRTTDEPRENRGEGRAATSLNRPKWGKAAGLPPQGKASPRPRRAKAKLPARLEPARKL